MNTLSTLISIYIMAIQIIIWLLIAHVIASWLIAFNVINPHNQFVRTILQGLDRLFEPVLGRIRRFMPDLGGLDLSPIVLFFGLIVLQRVVPSLVYDLAGVA